MIGRIHTLLHKIRWALEPSRWMIHLLGLSKEVTSQKQPGLILIQIDGLSYSHFHQAMKRGYLHFVKGLTTDEGYHDWHHYSGVPSSTPAIQAELFYGAKQYVPAFRFHDHKTGKIFTFYDSNAADSIEKRLEKKGEGLLSEGSSYSNIFKGGAKENAHFCASSIGWKAFFNALNPYPLTVLFFFNLFGVLRIIYYAVVELILAFVESLRGTFMGFGFREEFLFILSRLIVTVGLRELATIGVRMDIARGLPIIHVNFFGYDDQAHRRGPSSQFAYWALPGIDGCISRIWRAAQNSLLREYDVWLYSDHGQEEVTPYPIENKKTIQEAVPGVFGEMMPGENLDTLKVAAQGPIGFIYTHRALSMEEKDKMARALVEKAHVPLVMTEAEGNLAYAYTDKGKFLLPDEAGQVVGESHPFLENIGPELKKLCFHADSGVFVISGWRREGKSLSFPMEYGSHAGPGPQETDGFALIPRDIRVQTKGKEYLRPSDLHDTALGFLKGDEKIFYGKDPLRPLRHTLRIMTYNVHSCVGMDGKLSPERIARVIARHDPDVIALQELDAGRSRTKGIDQAQLIAKLLDMQYHFHPVLTIKEEMYGNAVMSRYPIKIVEAGSLPRAFGHSYFEPRGALWIEIEYLNERIQLFNTHLSFWRTERNRQAQALCSTNWLGHPNCRDPVILCGDFNALPDSKSCRRIRNKLEDVQLKVDRHKPLNTWFGHFPVGRIDHIFVSQNIEVVKIEVPSYRLEKMASDHLPLIAELKIPASKPEAAN
ncbi:MAG: endonuclease/exonuclease/phosphatase family protein [Candidatus Omnitrophica bacterium]|nr:endonuclease/exonuclease/phosphatase family protein [Candidatus Omnitrophota bacterium]